MERVELDGVASIGVTVSMAHSSRSYFSASYLDSAARAARCAYAIEYINKDPSRSEEHRQSVVTAVIMSAATIEAAINEVCCDVVDGYSEMNGAIAPGSADVLRLCWKTPMNMERLPAMEKYKMFVKICGADHAKQQFAKFTDQTQWADVKRLLGLRNLLMHYRPLTITEGDDGGEKTVRELRGHLESRIIGNQLTGAGNSFYPDKLLGHGCAKWSAETAAHFLKQFGETMNLSGTVFSRRLKDGCPPTQ